MGTQGAVVQSNHSTIPSMLMAHMPATTNATMRTISRLDQMVTTINVSTTGVQQLSPSGHTTGRASFPEMVEAVACMTGSMPCRPDETGKDHI